MKKKLPKVFRIDEMGVPTDTIDEIIAEKSLRSKCPVKVGDRFYRKSASVVNGTALRDYLKVIDIMPYKDHYAIKARYENHGIGPYERTFSSEIFKSDDWEIVRN